MVNRILVDRVWGSPIGRLLTLTAGLCAVFGLLTLYPNILPVIEWTIPAILVLWGASRFYLFGIENRLTTISGATLILGGFTYAFHLFYAVNGLSGALAQIIPILGIATELIASHRRH